MDHIAEIKPKSRITELLIACKKLLLRLYVWGFRLAFISIAVACSGHTPARRLTVELETLETSGSKCDEARFLEVAKKYKQIGAIVSPEFNRPILRDIAVELALTNTKQASNCKYIVTIGLVFSYENNTVFYSDLVAVVREGKVCVNRGYFRNHMTALDSVRSESLRGTHNTDANNPKLATWKRNEIKQTLAICYGADKKFMGYYDGS